MSLKRKTVLRILNKHYREMAEQYGISSLYLFGSVARDEARPDSDVDLMVEFIHPVSLFTLIELKQKLESILACKVDLGTKRSLKAHLVEEIDKEAIRVS